MKNLYIHFFRDLHIKNKISPVGINPTTLLLLHLVAVKNIEKKPLTITEAMSLSGVGSPATIHRKLDQLRDANLIESVFIGSNRRTKYIKTSKEANVYFEKLSDAMIKTVDSFRAT